MFYLEGLLLHLTLSVVKYEAIRSLNPNVMCAGCLVGGLPLEARAACFTSVGWAVTIDRGAKQRIAGAGTATATEPTRVHKQYAI